LISLCASGVSASYSCLIFSCMFILVMFGLKILLWLSWTLTLGIYSNFTLKFSNHFVEKIRAKIFA
jgi:hypothetical protein